MCANKKQKNLWTWNLFIFIHVNIHTPQSYCINLVSGNWKHLLVATGWSRVAAGDRWVQNISSIVFILWWVEGLGWLMDISNTLVNTFGTTSTNLHGITFSAIILSIKQTTNSLVEPPLEIYIQTPYLVWTNLLLVVLQYINCG